MVRLADASAPVNFPVNHVYSSDGTTLTYLTVQGWVESKPKQPHHAQRISMAAAIGEAAGIHKAVRIMKQARCASERAACSGAA